MQERPIPRWSGYWAREDGAILSRKKPELRILATHHGTGHDAAYLTVGLKQDGQRARLLVHRLMGEAWLGPLPAGLQTRHLDGDATNNAILNLRYGTARENTLDSIRHGTSISLRRGEAHPRTVITFASCEQMRALYATGSWTYAALGRAFGCSGLWARRVVQKQARVTA